MVNPISQEAGHKLTGKRRHRMGWRKKLVLQVEITYYLYTWQDHGKPYGDESWRFAWRDATINDISDGDLV